MKYCIKCGTSKDESAFNRCVSRADGLQTQCRECKLAYMRQYAESEHGKLKSKQYHAANKESRNAQSRKYRKVNAEKLNAACKTYYEQNKDKWKEANKRWYELADILNT